MAYKNKADQAASSRKHYQKNKALLKRRAIAHRKITKKRNYAFARRVKTFFGCKDCGTRDFRVLEFDHLRDKKANIATLIAGGCSIKTIKEEMRKCEVVCANCHRIRTYERIRSGIF